MAHLEATHELHTLDMLSLSTCVSGACEWTKSGGEDKVGASDIVVIACVRVSCRSVDSFIKDGDIGEPRVSHV